MTQNTSLFRPKQIAGFWLGTAACKAATSVFCTSAGAQRSTFGAFAPQGAQGVTPHRQPCTTDENTLARHLQRGASQTPSSLATRLTAGKS